MNQFARLIRVFRLVRAIKSISMISHAINENKASTSLLFMVVTSLMMMLFGSIYILYLEKDMPGTNIHKPLMSDFIKTSFDVSLKNPLS